MGVLGGLDVGFGANMQIVRTNYLCIKDSGAATTTQLADLLSLYNRVQTNAARGNNGLACDYILPMATQASDASSTSSGVVIETIDGSVMPVVGTANPASNQNTNHGIIGVLTVGVIEYSNADLNASAIVVVPAIADANADHCNSLLLLGMVGASALSGATTGLVKTINLTGPVADLLAACGTGTVAASAMPTYVEKGNASGATPTELSAITIGANAAGVISTVCLTGVGYA